MNWTISAISFAAVSSLFTAPPTFSQDTHSYNSSGSAAETLFEIDIAGLAFAIEGEAELLADLDARFRYENITDNGRRYGFVLAGRAERDSDRIAFGGNAGFCPAGQADCPDQPSRGYTSGLQAQAPAERDSGVRAAVTEAFLFLHSGWGEWRIGYGDGAARLDEVGGPSAFRTIRADGGRLDPTGVNHARTENYASGQAPKLVFRSIALGQRSTIGSFRASASITPEVGDCGVDFCAFGDGPGPVRSPEPDWVVELGGLYEVDRGAQEWAFSIGWARSENESPIAGFDRLESLDLGVSWRRGNWLAGSRWLTSNNAINGDAGYQAYSASVGYESGPWMTSLEWAAFSDDLVHADGHTWQVGTSWLGDSWLLGVGLQQVEREVAQYLAGSRSSEATDSTVVFLEASWRH